MQRAAVADERTAQPQALPREFHEPPRRTVIATMAGVCVAMFMAALDQTVVGTAMPRVIEELHGFQHYAGVLTAYMVASTVSVPIVGKLSDLYGRKLFLLTGVAVFMAASALCGAAHTMNQLIAFRGLQGLGAGAVMAMSFTTIADLFPPSRRGSVSGIMGSVFGLSSIVGPAVGGLLTDGPGWRYVFYVNLPVGLAALVVLATFFPSLRRTPTKPTIDYGGAVALVGAVVPLLLAISWGGRDYAWNSPVTLGLLVFGVAMAGRFVAVERTAKEPIIPLHLFKDRIVVSSLACSTLVAVGMFGATLFIPLFIQAVIGSSATASGAVTTPMMLGWIACSTVTGQLITRLGRYQVFAVVGVALTCVAMFLLARMDVSTHYVAVVRNMVILGMGLGMTMPVFTIAVQNAVRVEELGAATATLQFLRSIGGAMGAAVFGAVLVNRYVPAFRGALPADIAAKLSPEQLGHYNNPQLLMDPNATKLMAQDFAGFGAQSQDVAASVLAAIRQGLSLSLHDMFLLGMGVMVVATAIAFFVKDLPLRKSNRPGGAPVATMD